MQQNEERMEQDQDKQAQPQGLSEGVSQSDQRPTQLGPQPPKPDLRPPAQSVRQPTQPGTRPSYTVNRAVQNHISKRPRVERPGHHLTEMNEWRSNDILSCRYPPNVVVQPNGAITADQSQKEKMQRERQIGWTYRPPITQGFTSIGQWNPRPDSKLAMLRRQEQMQQQSQSGQSQQRIGSQQPQPGQSQQRIGSQQPQPGQLQQHLGPQQPQFGQSQQRLGPQQPQPGQSQQHLGPQQPKPGQSQQHQGPQQMQPGQQDPAGMPEMMSIENPELAAIHSAVQRRIQEQTEREEMLSIRPTRCLGAHLAREKPSWAQDLPDGMAGQMAVPKNALQQLWQIVNGPNTQEQQSRVLQILKENPPLMQTFLRERERIKEERKQLEQTSTQELNKRTLLQLKIRFATMNSKNGRLEPRNSGGNRDE